MAIGLFFRCVFGPRLYRIYRTTDEEGRLYTANIFEGYSDSIIKSLSLAWSITVYTSPLLISVLYRRGYYSFEGALSLGRLAGVLSLLLLGTLCLRTIGRCTNNNYLTFFTLLERAQKNMTKGNKIALSRYDFDFYAWPVEFAWNTTEDDKEKPKLYLTKTQFKRGTVFENIKGLPCQILSYLAIHSFGRRMIYPGTVKLLQSSVSQFLFQGRARLVEEHGAERYKLLARDGNEIDTVIVDRRRKSEFIHGKTLVICCEGNAGFYEYGIMGTPLEGGYSVLGWNHPGFAGSTGVPFPRNEENAIDVVMQFAVHKLQFKVEDIVIYAWSIGGYPATWAAMNYPDIKGLILDATFDDLLPLATARMPPSWKPLVTRTIKEYMNLNNGWQLCNYLGPVLLIRRTQDEMISTRETSPIATNRGNILLTKLLQCRYPKLLTEDTAWALKEWLAGDSAHQVILQSQQCVEEDLCLATLQSYVDENSSSSPMHIGDGMSLNSRIQLLLFLASKHMVEFDSTHCSPLPAGLFQMPWKLEGANQCSLLMNNTCLLPKDCNL